MPLHMRHTGCRPRSPPSRRRSPGCRPVSSPTSMLDLGGGTGAAAWAAAARFRSLADDHRSPTRPSRRSAQGAMLALGAAASVLRTAAWVPLATGRSGAGRVPTWSPSRTSWASFPISQQAAAVDDRGGGEHPRAGRGRARNPGRIPADPRGPGGVDRRRAGRSRRRARTRWTVRWRGRTGAISEYA